MKRMITGLLALCMVLTMFAGCAAQPQTPETTAQSAAPAPAPEVAPTVAAQEAPAAPKYVFLFIGDGMSYPQFQAAADYLGAIADDDYEKALPSTKSDSREGAVLDGPVALNFMGFEVAGSAVTYDSCSFAPDSASTATSIATGKKTYSGMINVDESGATPTPSPRSRQR